MEKWKLLKKWVIYVLYNFSVKLIVFVKNAEWDYIFTRFENNKPLEHTCVILPDILHTCLLLYRRVDIDIDVTRCFSDGTTKTRERLLNF